MEQLTQYFNGINIWLVLGLVVLLVAILAGLYLYDKKRKANGAKAVTATPSTPTPDVRTISGTFFDAEFPADASQTHCVEIAGLSSNTTYYFNIVSGGTIYGDQGPDGPVPFTVRTTSFVSIQPVFPNENPARPFLLNQAQRLHDRNARITEERYSSGRVRIS